MVSAEFVICCSARAASSTFSHTSATVFICLHQAHLGLALGGWGWKQSRMGRIWSACKRLVQRLLRNNALLSVSQSAVAAPLFLIRFFSILKSAASALRR